MARGATGFTMIEIALCLAIIGFALVSILLVLPTGMNTQRDTREQTIINEDASILLEAIRDGARGMDELTNYVYAITNYVTFYDNRGNSVGHHQLGYTPTSASIDNAADPTQNAMLLTNGLRIIGLLSTPEFTVSKTVPPYSGGLPLANTFGQFYTSNYIVAYMRSLSGLAAEKPPQDNAIMQGSTFAYQIRCVNAPPAMAMDTNTLNQAGSNYVWQLTGNLHELRLLFSWPQHPNGKVGPFRQNFRASIAGQLAWTDYSTNGFQGIQPLYFYESQSFATNTAL